MKNKLRVLICGDGPNAVDADGLTSIYTTGFGQVVQALAGGLHDRGFDVHVLGLNYPGDPTGLPYRLYTPSSLQRDLYGVLRLGPLCSLLKPDVVFLLNDPWICEEYIKHLTLLGDKMPAIVCYVPIDAEGYAPRHVAWCHRAHDLLGQAFRLIPYTFFGKQQLYKAGYGRTSAPIGHGLDKLYREAWYPGFAEGEVSEPIKWETVQKERIEARIEFGHAGIGPETFIVMNNDRNSERKRLDILIDAFAKFARMVKDKEGYVAGPTRDEWGMCLSEVANYERKKREWEEEFRVKKESLVALVPDMKAVMGSAMSSVVREGVEVSINIDIDATVRGIVGPPPMPPETPEWERDPLVKLWLHTDLTEYWNLPEMLLNACRREGLTDEEAECLLMVNMDEETGKSGCNLPTDQMRRIYLAVGENGCYVKTAHGEGWGLGSFEAAACGCDLILPENTVHRELWGDTPAWFAPCPVERVSPIGLTSKAPMAEHVAEMMFDSYRRRKGELPPIGTEMFHYATSDRFDWGRIVDRFVVEIEAAAAGRKAKG